ncbi:MAG: replication factor C large subunit, partial [Methanoculleus sp.]
ELNLFINDKPRAARVVREAAKEEKEAKKTPPAKKGGGRAKKPAEDAPKDEPGEARRGPPPGQATLF